MKWQSILVLMVATFAVTGVASADIFFDNFDSENGGQWAYNFNAFTNWTCVDGAVDLIGSPGRYDYLPGHGLYVDMDGTWTYAGKIVSTPLQLQPGGYTLSFDLAGSQRDGYDPVDYVIVTVGDGSLFSKTYSLSWYEPFHTFTEHFTVSTPMTTSIGFQGLGRDSVGMLLDNVRLTPVPGAFLLGTIGLSFAGLKLRKRIR